MVVKLLVLQNVRVLMFFTRMNEISLKYSIENLKSCYVLKVLYKCPMMIQCESKRNCISDILFEIELCVTDEF